MPSTDNPKLILKIATIAAVSGLCIVILSILTNILYPLTPFMKSLMLVAGFTMMLLGTLWKVVIEMNQAD
jgi:hypothetical protein